MLFNKISIINQRLKEGKDTARSAQLHEARTLLHVFEPSAFLDLKIQPINKQNGRSQI